MTEWLQKLKMHFLKERSIFSFYYNDSHVLSVKINPFETAEESFLEKIQQDVLAFLKKEGVDCLLFCEGKKQKRTVLKATGAYSAQVLGSFEKMPTFDIFYNEQYVELRHQNIHLPFKIDALKKETCFYQMVLEIEEDSTGICYKEQIVKRIRTKEEMERFTNELIERQHALEKSIERIRQVTSKKEGVVWRENKIYIFQKPYFLNFTLFFSSEGEMVYQTANSLYSFYHSTPEKAEEEALKHIEIFIHKERLNALFDDRI